MNIDWLQLGAGFLLAILISAAAYRLRSLDTSGALAATLLGTAIFGLGGLPWAVLLLGFFISSSLLSRLFKPQKAAVDEKFSKGSRRDAGQVLANGGAAGALVILQALFPDAAWLYLAGAASLAAANADTWATELGVLSPSAPRLITSGRQVEMGTSGGITLLGTLAALSGALFIALLAWAAWPVAAARRGLLPASAVLVIVSLSGLVGSLVDSLLGATLQAIYHCPACDKETERFPTHTCGSATTHTRGWLWLNNDWVNLACTTSAALLAALITALITALAAV